MNNTAEWDKTFPKDDRVLHQEVSFYNRYGIRLAADTYTLKSVLGKKPAVIVCGPLGAVKEQCSGLYAQQMALRGFLAIAFDPSYCGESGGEPRDISSPDINTEDYSGAVDFLMSRDDVDVDRIGIIGIGAWGGIAICAALQDTRISAAVTISLEIVDNMDIVARKKLRQHLNELRTKYVTDKALVKTGSMSEDCPEGPSAYVENWNYFMTDRGWHDRSETSYQGWQPYTLLPWLTFSLFDHASEIDAPVLLIHGANAFSLSGSLKAFEAITGVMATESSRVGNKELIVIDGLSHTDLYDKIECIPFDKIEGLIKS